MRKEISRMKVSFDLNGNSEIKWFKDDVILNILDSNNELVFYFDILRYPYVHKSFLETIEIKKYKEGDIVEENYFILKYIGVANFVYEHVDEIGERQWNYNPRYFFINKGENHG